MDYWYQFYKKQRNNMTRYDLQFIVLGIIEHSDIKPTNVFEIGSRDGHDAPCIGSDIWIKRRKLLYI